MNKALQQTVATLLMLFSFVCIYFSGHYVGKMQERWYGTRLGTAGELLCGSGGEIFLKLPSEDIVYLGNGEWKIRAPNGMYTTYVKGVVESCMVALAEKPITGPYDNDKSAPSKPIAGDKGELNVQKQKEQNQNQSRAEKAYAQAGLLPIKI